MRLLRRDQSGCFSLTQWSSQNIPPYAILSHRWGADEVSFRDIEQGMASTKDGHKKLEFCAEQATRDRLTYFWIDACCIDKASSAELSEAINSMYKWYQRAAKCYVYLANVSAGHGWELVFRNSDWFTRGWTLQELIAPATVEFFSVEGTKLGDKRSLEQQICQITGISIEVLRGKPLGEVDRGERFSWTGRRETEKEEDGAYCLLGIFNVHLPPIYGEGRQNALLRLQREIQLSSSANAFVIRNAPWIVPFERNPRFTGREIQLTELEEKLFIEDCTSKIAITGLGGVGKTQLVLELLYRTKEKHADCSIMWIAATTIESLQQGYLTVAQQLEIPGREDEKADVKQLVQDYLSQEDAGPWVLVFDNADDINPWTAVTLKRKREDEDGTTHDSSTRPQRLIDYLPRNKRGCIIFTTRNQEAAVKFAPQNIIAVPEMSEEAATQLLKRSLANPDLANQSVDITILLAALAYLPLAITQATAYINTKGYTLAEYILLLGKTEQETIDVLSEEFEDYGRYQNVKNPVATTWLVSFEQIRRSDPLAAEYLSFIACIHSRDVPQSLLPPGPSRKKEMDAIGTLVAYSFVSRRPTDTTLDLHRLVHLATRNWLRTEGLLSQWTERTITHLARVFPDDNDENRATWRRYLPHALQVLASDLVGTKELKLALMLKCGQCLYSDGRWDEAETIYTEVLTSEIETLGEDHPFTLSSMANLASTYREQGRWEEAEQLDVQVMDTGKTKLGADHPFTLSGMANLASTYWNQGRWEKAEQLFVQVMETRKTKLGADHPDTLTSMANLASTYRNQGRWTEAEQLEVQVMETRKTKLGADHPHTLTSMNNLAFTWKGLGRDAEATQLMRECVERQSRILGATHPNSLTSQQTLSQWVAEGRDISVDPAAREDMN